MKLLVLFVYIFFFSSNLFANDKVAILDLDKVLSDTIIGKKLLSNLENEEDKIFTNFKNKEKELKEQESKILASRNILSEEQFNIDVKEFQKKVNKYKTYKNKSLEELNKKKKEEFLKILTKINPIIEKYMQENSISIIHDKKNVFIANKNYDITENIVKLVNKNIIN